MTTFRLDQTQFKTYRIKILARSIPLLSLPLLYVIFTSRESAALPILVPLFTVIVAGVLWNSIRRQRKAWQTFTLVFYDDRLERKADMFPGIVLPIGDIKEVIENSDGGFTIVANNRMNNIGVPFSVESKEKLVSILEGITSVRKATINTGLIAAYAGSVIGLGLFVAFSFSSNRSVRLTSGILLCVLMVWGFVEIQRNKSVEKRVKRTAYVSLFVLLIFIFQLITIWLAG